MNKALVALLVSAPLALGGCASVTPPPDRAYWDEAPASTQCTDEKSGVVAQYTGSLLAAALGGADIGTGLAVGYFPVIGIGLAGIGIAGGNDADNKFNQIEKCEEFKKYLVLRETKKSAPKADAAQSAGARLSRLDKLLEEGTITKEEYDEFRRKVLSDI